MKRIGLAGLLHETNTFSNTPTPLEHFINADGFYPPLLRGDEIHYFQQSRMNISSSGFLADAPACGFIVLPLAWCGAEPSAPASQEVFDYLMGLIEEELAANLPLDGLYLDLHGAMVYGNLQDGETEILKRARRLAGDIPIVVSLDLHGNISEECFQLADVLVGYRTYPHVDAFETGQQCARVLKHLLDGKPLKKTFRMSPFLMPATTQPTTIEPARSLYALLPQVELQPGVVSVSMMEGFNACDLPHTGPSIFTYAETQASADQAADFLLDEMLKREAAFSVNLLPPDQAVREAIQLASRSPRPVILVDVQDNAGGGSPSDTVWLLDEIVRQRAPLTALGVFWDPAAARAAHEAGEGARVEIELGGHSLPGHKPYKAFYTVEKIHAGEFTAHGPMLNGRSLNLGKMAQLSLGETRIVVSEERMQALDQDLFRVVGIEPAGMKILALKSANHYRADFGPLAGAIINVDAPSAIIEDPSKIPYTQLREGVRLKGLGPVFHRPA